MWSWPLGGRVGGAEKGVAEASEAPRSQVPSPSLGAPPTSHAQAGAWHWDPRAKNKPGRDSLEIGLRVNQNRVLSFPLGLCRGLG